MQAICAGENNMRGYAQANLAGILFSRHIVPKSVKADWRGEPGSPGLGDSSTGIYPRAKSWKKEWTTILVLFLFFRLLYSLLGVLEASGPDPEPLSGGPVFDAAATLLKQGALSHALVNVWFRWDTIWYLKIAAFGYSSQDGTLAFMPLYPWLVRGLGALTGNYLLSALIISNLACLLALFLFYEVVLDKFQNKEIALWGTFLLASFPSAFFLFTAYTDSLFLALALAAWLFARRGMWPAAGLLAALATLCRLQGALLSIVFLWVFLSSRFLNANGANEPIARQINKENSRHSSIRDICVKVLSNLVTLCVLCVKSLKKPDWLALFLPTLTFAVYTLWLRLAGWGSIPATLETHWGIRTVPPWTGFGLFLQRLVSGQRVFIDYVDLTLFLVMLLLLVVGLFRLDPALSLYNFLTLSLFFMRGTPPHLLDSFSRYFLTLFPAFIMVAQLWLPISQSLATINIGSLRPRMLLMVLWSVSIGLQIFLLMGFLDWRWIA
jgi:hypothetical protein